MVQQKINRCLACPSSAFTTVRSDSRIASENQTGEGEMAGLAGTLEECLEALGILLNNPGAEPSGTFSFWRSQGELGDAPGRGHCVYAECLGILNILEQETQARPFPPHPSSAQPIKNATQCQICCVE